MIVVKQTFCQVYALETVF